MERSQLSAPCLLLCFLAMLAASFSTDVLACSKHGTNAGATLVSIYGEADDSFQIRIRVGVESELVEPEATTTCVAGMGLGSTDMPLDARIRIVDMQIEVVDRPSGNATAIPAFNFGANRLTSEGLAAGSGDSAPGDPNPSIPGATWFGFSSEVDPFRLVLGAEEFVRMIFIIDMPITLLPLLTKAQIAAGEGEPDGSPIFEGEHPVSYFTGMDHDLLLPLPERIFSGGFED